MMFMSVMSVWASAQTSIQVQTHNVVSLDEQFTVSFVIEGNRPSEFEWEPGEDFNLLCFQLFLNPPIGNAGFQLCCQRHQVSPPFRGIIPVHPPEGDKTADFA